ncbi:type I-E CRISPR-associated protein Cas7/Cse4/CasC [Tsukamurella sp. NPDC003166]|uniref:type I-E CRISPR-associated protein Cas7/Cse4/CasC n=1 Tax=Tsukamurella sp. NPDC003166 TaxID=3154444 RepID=UPI0033BBE2AB
MSIYIDYHVIQTVPPANINRDEDGSPKSTTFGGTRRARVSSQAWKRAIRRDFADHLDVSELGVRSLRLVADIAQRITERTPEITGDAADDLAAAALKAAGIKTEKSQPRKDSEVVYTKTGALLFLGNPQIDELARLAADAPDGKIAAADAKNVLARGHSIDLALFGRMIADSPDLKVDAAAQVAHAIGVHPLVSEFDYFTAVDDRQDDDNAGAGMIGTVEFNASTLYRYATVNVSALHETLGSGEATARGVEAFTRSFITSMPTGKQNTFANRTLPDFVLVSVRDDQPINLASAFEDAIETPGNRARAAAELLLQRAVDTDTAYGLTPILSLVVGTPGFPTNTDYAAAVNLPDLIERVTSDACARVGESS